MTKGGPGRPQARFGGQPWGAYLGEDALEAGVDVGISSWTRPAPNTVPTGAKAGGNYVSSQLIAMEAERLGYAEGIALDTSGTVSEGSGENIFLVRDGVLVTPPTASSILPGITRDIPGCYYSDFSTGDGSEGYT